MPSTTNPQGRSSVEVGAKAPPPLGSYSHAIVAGNMIYLAGQGARRPGSGKEAGVVLDQHGEVVAYDIAVQTRAVLENLKTVLTAAECSLENVVDVTVFLKDMKDFDAYNKVYGEYFAFENPPARTTVGVATLPGKNYIEIKAIAYKPQT